MDLEATLDAPVSPGVLFPWVEDLVRYPRWLEIVSRAESVGSVDSDAWLVDLRGRLGPLARSKRLRMVRSVHEPPSEVVFERREDDGRSHAPWVLGASVTPTGTGSRLVMRLHYGGSLWGPVIERLLSDEIERARPRLLELVARERQT